MGKPEKIADNVLAWGADGIEANTIEQAQRTARLPFLAGHLALMPDAHLGFGSTVGSVIPTRGAIVPSAIGVDIGCGMIAARLALGDGGSLRAEHLPDDLTATHAAIAAAVPAGVGRGHDAAAPGWTTADPPAALARSEKLARRAATQFGSLGSGNHFLELSLDESDDVWLVLHSGSRGVGKELAERHIAEAKGLMRRWFIELEEPDLAYLVEGTPEFDEYLHDMLWAQAYAMANRDRMLGLALAAVAGALGVELGLADVVNCHHNFTEREHHHGQDMWITRKGAIRARTGDRGVIPGSMGTETYIVAGLGNPASYASCSHGAGRKMSRGEARRRFTADDLAVHIRGRAWNEAQAAQLVDEIPGSYKDIGEVMAAQSDLVSVTHRLRQVLNYKGT